VAVEAREARRETEERADIIDVRHRFFGTTVGTGGADEGLGVDPERIDQIIGLLKSS